MRLFYVKKSKSWNICTSILNKKYYFEFCHRVCERSIYNFKQPQRHIHDKSFAKDIKTRAETQNLFEVRAM